MRTVESLCPYCTAQCAEPQTSFVDVANIGHTRFDNYVIVQLNGLSRGTKDFSKHRGTYEMFRGLKLGFQARAHEEV